MNGAPPDVPPSRAALGLAFAAIYLLWGSTYLGIRVAVETMPPFAMAAARFALAGGVLYAFLRWRGAPRPSRGQLQDAAVVGAFLLLGGNGAVAWAEQYVPSGITALIIGATPLFMVLTEWAWPGGTRPRAAIFVAMAVGLLGVGYLAAPTEAGTTRLHTGGLIAILTGCLAWAVGSIYARHVTSGASPFMSAALQMLCGSGFLALMALFHGDFARLDLAAIAPQAWWAFGYLVIFGSLVGFSTFVWLLRHSTPARVSTNAYVNPLVAVVLGWALLDETITLRTWVAAALIVTAVAVITLQQTKPRTARG